jgi:alkylation response protein AidB-like acyl-CoA dehydrogenase
MDFELNDEQRAIRDTARDLLASRDRGEEVWAELCELGWPGIAIAEEYGGQGLGLVELVVLTEQMGYACASTPFLGTTLAALTIEAAGDPDQRSSWMPELAAGRVSAALALSDAPALVPDAAPERPLVLAERSTGTAVLHASGAVTEIDAIDPGRLHGIPTGDPGSGERMPGGVAAALDRASVVVAAELIGLCRRALETTVAYVKERKQFGVPVGSFQAVQHAAAQMLRDTEAAAVATYFAAWTADFEPEELPAAAAIAKASASDAGRSVTAAAIQLHGGIGFTWEADLHWLFKRAQVDAVYLGGAGYHRARVSSLVAEKFPVRSVA